MLFQRNIYIKPNFGQNSKNNGQNYENFGQNLKTVIMDDKLKWIKEDTLQMHTAR